MARPRASDFEEKRANLSPSAAAVLAAVIRRLRPDLSPALVMPATISLLGMMNWVRLWFRDDHARLATRLLPGGLPTAAAALWRAGPGCSW